MKLNNIKEEIVILTELQVIQEKQHYRDLVMLMVLKLWFTIQKMA